MADCTITMKPGTDEFGEATIVVRVKPESFTVQPNQAAVTWDVINKTSADETVKLRAFRNQTSMAGPHNPYVAITRALKVTVPDVNSGNNRATIVLDMDPAKAFSGHLFKYNIHIGKVVAVDPEIEIA